MGDKEEDGEKDCVHCVCVSERERVRKRQEEDRERVRLSVCVCVCARTEMDHQRLYLLRDHALQHVSGSLHLH